MTIKGSCLSVLDDDFVLELLSERGKRCCILGSVAANSSG
jgi:hypothetical protein